MSEDLNPYQPPQAPAPTAPPRNRLTGCMRGSLGCGCFIPFVLFLIAGLSGDLGGPLFWPLLVLVGTVVGAAIGTLFAPRGKKPL
ncbi:putative lipid-binding transport protein (Tim44 family) [Prosthecobacter vanneervenii]|uniref:Putative lipid-binding transport protein (Tim44 family) n=1 Tax=Prosthecobacter vanneervenii TaxID=48466 RepID=A0A7W8DJV8_9BACT|nr:putative lipid-binding transport protein (Tim44 family) [Prosthecobacter vanneervenii]